MFNMYSKKNNITTFEIGNESIKTLEEILGEKYNLKKEDINKLFVENKTQEKNLKDNNVDDNKKL